MPTWAAALIAVGAICSTYFFCVRPARHGKCAMSGSSAQAAGAQDLETDRQLAQLREELRMLRAQDALDAGRVPHARQMPPADI